MDTLKFSRRIIYLTISIIGLTLFGCSSFPATPLFNSADVYSDEQVDWLSPQPTQDLLPRRFSMNVDQGDIKSQQFNVCEAQVYRFVIRWSPVQQNSGPLDLMFLQLSANYVQRSLLSQAGTYNFVINILASGILELRFDSRYTKSNFEISYDYSQPGADCETDESVIELPAARQHGFSSYRLELTWDRPVDLDFSSRLSDPRGEYHLGWRTRDLNLYGELPSRFFDDANSSCLLARENRHEYVEWVLPAKADHRNKERLRFYIHYFDGCNESTNDVPIVNYTIHVVGAVRRVMVFDEASGEYQEVFEPIEVRGCISKPEFTYSFTLGQIFDPDTTCEDATQQSTFLFAG